MVAGVVDAIGQQLTRTLCPDTARLVLEIASATSIQYAWRNYHIFSVKLAGWHAMHTISPEQFQSLQLYGFWGSFSLAFLLPCVGWCVGAALAKREHELVIRFAPLHAARHIPTATVAAAAAQVRLQFGSHGCDGTVGTWLLLNPPDNAAPMDIIATTRCDLYLLRLPIDCFQLQ